MIFSCRLKLASAICFLSCLAACESESTLQDVSAQRTVAQGTSEITSSNTVRSKNDKGLQQHHPLSKPGAAVSLNNMQPLTASTPGIYDYQLELISPATEGEMTVDLAPGNGIAIISSVRHFEFPLRDQGEYRVPVTVNASAEGRFYIQLHVSITTGGLSSSRVIAAILQVGEPAVKVQKAAEKGATKEADTVISLPAQETISPR